MIRAALALYEATGQGAYLEQALAWQRAFDAHYANPGNGGYFLTAADAEGLVVRPASTSDDATPNPNSIAAQNLVRLAALTGDAAWREQADRLFDGVLAGAADNLLQHAELLNALDLRLHAAEIVVTGPDHARFAAAALKLPYLNRIMLRAPDAGALPASHPAQAKIAARAGQRRVRLRRRDLFAAGDRSGQDRGCGQRDAAGDRSRLERPRTRRYNLPGTTGGAAYRAARLRARPACGRGAARAARGFGLDLLGAGAAARAPQHRDPGGDVFARAGSRCCCRRASSGEA